MKLTVLFSLLNNMPEAIRRAALVFCVLGLVPFILRADSPTYIFDPLPKPLVLPPGNVETLPINPDISFYGDQFRIVDCSPDVTPAFPNEPIASEVGFGICGNQLFGGVAIFDSHLHGSLTFQFIPTSATTAHFVVSMHSLFGDDGTVTAPLGYNFPVTHNEVSDALVLSSGDVDLISGYVNPNSIQWNASFVNSGLLAIGNVNPKLAPPIVTFPGARGFAWANFVQRPDGLLDFYFRGSTFLPLGNDIDGDPVRFPLPYCNPSSQCASVLARGTSFHPHIQLDTRDSLGYTPCAPNCPDIPTNTIEVFNVHARYTAFGDDFDLRIPELGGVGPGRSELMGRVQIQFGPRAGNGVPFQLALLPPEGLFAEPPNSPLLGPGFRGFMIGANQQLHFPNYLYNQHKLVFADEVHNRASGMIDLASGQIVGEFIYPMYIDQSIIEQLVPDNHGRVTLDPFFQVAERAPQNPTDPNYAFFEKEPNGETMVRLNLFHHRSFETYCYPQPQFILNQCWFAPANSGSNLNIFGKIQAARLPDPGNPGDAVLGDNKTFTSSIGDTFSYNFSVACNPIGKPFSMTYTNNNTGPSGGTFTMKHIVSVSCTNSKVSTAAPGNYDQISITGFGSWSKDPVLGATQADLPTQLRFIAASISVDPANPFAEIIVFNNYPGENLKLPGALVLTGDEVDVNLSTAENKPPTKPTP
ncbi:MAG TPA: hypothetical protein VG297_14685 [Bryobacteraceae bacterium]|nr:hypothetical protein [Bryobacteraceae bacterium]